MRYKIYAVLLFLIGFCDCMGQPPIELTSITYTSYEGKTLSLIEIPEVSNQLIKSLDSLSRKYLKQPMVKSENFKIANQEPNLEYLRTRKPVAEKSVKRTRAGFELAITQMPLNSLLDVPEMDSSFIKELLLKLTVGFIQFNAKLFDADGRILLNKDLNVVLSRNKTAAVIGFLNYEYLTTPKSLSKLLEIVLPILIDSSNETEILQMVSAPAIMADNFIQPYIKNAPKRPAAIYKGIIQYIKNNQLQYLRYQAPAYEPIVLRGKKQTPIPESLLQSINDNHVKEPIYLREESRDILADKNYLLQTVAYIEMNTYINSGISTNVKIGLPFRFLPSPFHVLLQDKDTVGIFSIVANKKYPDKRRILNQLYSTIDSSFIHVPSHNNIKEYAHTYNYVLTGTLKDKSFQIFNSGMHGSPGAIREIFYKDQLVCVAQGKDFPELIAFIDESIDTVTLNQLLLIAFSSLF